MCLYGSSSWPILVGAKLVVAQAGVHTRLDASERCAYDTIPSQPSILSRRCLDSFLQQTGEVDYASLRQLVCSGEALSGTLAYEFRRRYPGVQLHNLYGPTEATVDVTAWTYLTQTESTPVPIGKPIANTQIYILDGCGEPVPVGVGGELYIGGAGVARGYLNRPELTAERFLRDPFSSDPDARVYRTGDLGRWLPDGNIEFLGRNDFQVKIRGFRIELGEIESRLLEVPEIRAAAVIAREDKPGDKRLVAYYVAEDETIAAALLRPQLMEKLPEYMVPAAYVRLDAMPLTASGKLDRRALPAPDAEAYVVRGYEAPQGEIETELAAIWAEVLVSGRSAATITSSTLAAIHCWL